MSKNGQLFEKPEVLLESDTALKLTDAQLASSKRLQDILSSYIEGNQTRVIAYLGSFGCGKSVVVNNAICNLQQREDVHFVKFDIWQHQDVTMIWESFLIEAASAITCSNQSEIIDDIDGVNKRSPIINWALKHPFISTCIISIIYSAISYILWANFRDSGFVKSFLIYSTPCLFSALAFLGISSLIPQDKKTPLKRLQQYESYLAKKLNEITKPLLLYIEDVDRSDNGLLFLEALKIYLSALQEDLKMPVIAICPQSPSSFGAADSQNGASNHLSRSVKIYDSVINSFLPRDVSPDEVNLLLKESGYSGGNITDIVCKLLGIGNVKETYINLRILKMILREVNEFSLKYGGNSDLAFLFIASRYIAVDGFYSERSQTLADEIKTILMNDTLRSYYLNIKGEGDLLHVILLAVNKELYEQADQESALYPSSKIFIHYNDNMECNAEVKNMTGVARTGKASKTIDVSIGKQYQQLLF